MMGNEMEPTRRTLHYGAEVVPPALRRQIVSTLVVLLLVGGFLMLVGVLGFRPMAPVMPPAAAPAPPGAGVPAPATSPIECVLIPEQRGAPPARATTLNRATGVSCLKRSREGSNL